MRQRKVLIKGAGDLATGIACRLHNSGFQVVMTELAVPTTVRRTLGSDIDASCGQLRRKYEKEATSCRPGD